MCQAGAPPENSNWNLHGYAKEELVTQVVHQEDNPDRAAPKSMELRKWVSGTRKIDHQESVRETIMHLTSKIPVRTNMRI